MEKNNIELHLMDFEGKLNPKKKYFDVSKYLKFVKSKMENKKTIFELEEERYAWSLATFPKASAIGSLNKLRDEVDEIEENIKEGKRDVMEYADVLMCLFDSARRQENPILIQEIFDAFEQKLEINKKRIWSENDNGSYSHVK